MKNIFIGAFLLSISGILFSFQTSINESDLIGSWRVINIQRGASTEKGEKIVTFTRNHKTTSEDIESGRVKYGKWSYKANKNELHLTGGSRKEVYSIVSLTTFSLVIQEDGKTITLSKIDQPELKE